MFFACNSRLELQKAQVSNPIDRDSLQRKLNRNSRKKQGTGQGTEQGTGNKEPATRSHNQQSATSNQQLNQYAVELFNGLVQEIRKDM
jgi:hypothetical protein